MGMFARPWGLSILGVGGYVPEQVVTNGELEAAFGLGAGWIEERTGIVQRHVAAPDQATSDLAEIAARRALAAAGVDPADLGLVVVGSCTPDRLFPATACRLQHLIGARSAVAFDVSAACSGFMFALHTAVAWLQASYGVGPALVVGADVLSRFADPEDRPTKVIFGDGAGAAVVGPSPVPGIEHLNLGSDGSLVDYVSIPAGGSQTPATLETVLAGRHYMAMRGRDVSAFVRSQLAGLLEDEMRAGGVSNREITRLVPHQPNPKLIRSVAEEAGFDSSRMVLTAERVGNIGAASVPYTLADGVARGAIRPGDKLLLAAIGAGMTWATGLLTWAPTGALVRPDRPEPVMAEAPVGAPC